MLGKGKKDTRREGKESGPEPWSRATIWPWLNPPGRRGASRTSCEAPSKGVAPGSDMAHPWRPSTGENRGGRLPVPG